MMDVVVDSGVFVAALVPDETLKTQAIRLLADCVKNRYKIHMPVLAQSELASALGKVVHQKRLLENDAKTYFSDFMVSNTIFHNTDKAFLEESLSLSIQYSRPRGYDKYVVLARRLNCNFWTADKNAYNAFATVTVSTKMRLTYV